MLLRFLESIGELIASVVGIVINFFTMLITLVQTVPKAITYIFGAVGFMPPFVGSIILVSIGISILITVLNHWSN